MVKTESPHEGKKVSEQKSEKNAAPHVVPPRTNNGETASASQLQKKKNICTCPACRDDTSVAVSQGDKKYLVDRAAALTAKYNKPFTVKETLAGIISAHRQGASA
jgi:hypothetical protein